MATLSLDTLNGLPAADFVAALGNIFEHAPWVAEAVAPQRPFATVAALYAAMQAAIKGAGEPRQLALIKGHPDLADRAQRAAGLTAESTAEQSGLGLDSLTDAEYDAFTRVNGAYRAKFGFPYIVCARRHTKDTVLRDFERRQPNDAATEIAAALAEIGRIGALRLDLLVEGPGRLSVNGRLSTHVLDTHSGSPAAGVELELRELCALGPSRLIARAVTNADGRTDQPLIHGRPLPMGHYELTFRTGAYFAARGVPRSDPPFLDVIPIRFGVAEPEGHLHVPLLVTPWSYATYRGS
jgi:2-oxo-4-hydroxy-4-carboxy-5-ureidoimidazoline decarboxylase